MLNLSALLIIAVHLFNSADSLYFHIAETERKCFIEEIPDETNVIGKYCGYVESRIFSFYFPLQLITKWNCTTQEAAVTCPRQLASECM